MSDGNFPTKWAKKLPDGFMDSVESMSTEDLKQELIKCERTISAVEKDMENDDKLAEAKELVKDLAGAYRDTIGAQKAKVKAIVWTLDNRGVA